MYVTLTPEGLAGDIVEWTVADEENLSRHRNIQSSTEGQYTR